jgi:hypothetical protein
MSTLDDETLKGVGRFAVEFGTLDETISHFAADILECTEWGIAEHLTTNLTIGRKLELIRDVARKLATKYAFDLPHAALSAQIVSMKTLIDHRNTVLHGSVTIKRGQNPIVEAKTSLELTPNKLSDLIGQDRSCHRRVPVCIL